MGALGILFLFVVLAQNLASPPVSGVVAAVGWVLWAVFVAELALRVYVADDRRQFWRRNWWQVLFLAVPFLRFARALRAVRVGRIGGVLTSAVRGSRSGGRLLTSRVGWLALISTVVIMASSQLLVLLGAYDRYVDALHAAALGTVAAEPLSSDHGAARWLEVGLAVYSVAVFATLAGALGAFFLEQERSAGLGVARRDRRGTV